MMAQSKFPDCHVRVFFFFENAKELPALREGHESDGSKQMTLDAVDFSASEVNVEGPEGGEVTLDKPEKPPSLTESSDVNLGDSIRTSALGGTDKVAVRPCTLSHHEAKVALALLLHRNSNVVLGEEVSSVPGVGTEGSDPLFYIASQEGRNVSMTQSGGEIPVKRSPDFSKHSFTSAG